jgi:hypothetical protein
MTFWSCILVFLYSHNIICLDMYFKNKLHHQKQEIIIDKREKKGRLAKNSINVCHTKRKNTSTYRIYCV